MSDVQPIEDLFCKLIALDTPIQRARFLGHVCKDDRSLREQLEKLLAAHEEAGSFLRGNGVDATAEDTVEQSGVQIGPYKLLQKIGEGGFGVVYMAEQLAPVRRKVALKLIKPGMDSKQVIARFEAERQALAIMDHPCVAKVLDGGVTESGRPYFVMELVRGVPITEFCDGNNLSTRERLELFSDVCDAVRHAHQKGIIHRDLKPRNVMVTLLDNRPVPKVIDFGVSKALNQELTEKTLFTAYGQLIGTPAYMSPEQAQLSAMDVDTRSDVYSLGVLLYELLTGSTPLESQRLRATAFAEMQRIIREEEPPKPSTRISTTGTALAKIARQRATDPRRLYQFIKGDVDWIVMKALEKNRNHRYDTASSFADDVRRFLNNEPIEARPPSTWYRIRKHASRNKLAVASTSILAIALLTSSITFGWAYFSIKRASTNEALATYELLAQSLEAESKHDDAATYYEKLAELQQAEFGPIDRRALKNRYRLAGVRSKQGRFEESIELYQEVLAEQKTAFGDDDPDVMDTANGLHQSASAECLQLCRVRNVSPEQAHRAAELAQLAEKMVTSFGVGSVHQVYLCRAAAQYRLRKYDECHQAAKQWLASGSRHSINAFYLLLAMANHQLGREDVARDWMDVSHAFNSGVRSAQFERHWLDLQQEAKGLILGSPESVVGDLTTSEQEQIFTRLISVYPDARRLIRFRGYARVQLGKWDLAGSDFANAVAGISDDAAREDFYYHACHALQSLHREDLDSYREACRKLFELFATQSRPELETGAIVCLLSPASDVDHARLYSLSHGAVGQGLAAYRMGNYASAAELLNRNLSGAYEALALLFSSMANHKMGNTQLAEEKLEAARRIIEQEAPLPDRPMTKGNVKYHTTAIWYKPICVLGEAEQLIKGP